MGRNKALEPIFERTTVRCLDGSDKLYSYVSNPSLKLITGYYPPILSTWKDVIGLANPNIKIKC